MTAGHELAQVNIARLVAPLDSPALADFVANLEPVNAAADSAPGFVWRLQDESGDATAITAFEWDAEGSAGVIVNLSVWRDADALADFVFGDLHRSVLRRRRDWFLLMPEAYVACWWVRAGERPTTQTPSSGSGTCGRTARLRPLSPFGNGSTLRSSSPRGADGRSIGRKPLR